MNIESPKNRLLLKLPKLYTSYYYNYGLRVQEVAVAT